MGCVFRQITEKMHAFYGKEDFSASPLSLVHCHTLSGGSVACLQKSPAVNGGAFILTVQAVISVDRNLFSPV
jgi:hypothetical protein